MEDAASPDLLVDATPEVRPLEAPSVALPGRQLAETLHHDQYPALVRFLLFAGATWPEAQDAAQDAFTKMCTPGLTISRPKAWLRTVAWRSWVSQKVRPEEACADLPEPELSLRWQTPAYAAEIGEEARLVVEHLLRLPSKQRAALAWNLDGFTTEETARAMGTTQVAVRQNLSRARAALKASLALYSAHQDDETPRGES